jgi:hypothetical protein
MLDLDLIGLPSAMTRAALFTSGVFLVAAALDERAQAQNYPWCAIYSQNDDGRTCASDSATWKQCTATVAGQINCGFATREQCLETVRGNGGFCEPNTQYVPPSVAPGRRH